MDGRRVRGNAQRPTRRLLIHEGGGRGGREVDKFNSTDWTHRWMGCGGGEQRGIEDSAEISGSPDWVDDSATYRTGETERLGVPSSGQLHVTREAPPGPRDSNKPRAGTLILAFPPQVPCFPVPLPRADLRKESGSHHLPLPSRKYPRDLSPKKYAYG